MMVILRLKSFSRVLGGKDGGHLGRASAPGLGFSLFSGEVCCVLGVSPYTLTTLPGAAEGSQVLPEASSEPPLTPPKSRGPAQLQALPYLDFKAWGLRPLQRNQLS